MNDMLSVMSPKKKKIFEALTSFILEGKNPEAITVADIAAKASIGKGTVYEYFSCKEDIYKEALLFHSANQLEIIKKIIAEQRDFKNTFFKIAEYLIVHSKESCIFLGFIMKAINTNDNLCFIGQEIADKIGSEVKEIILCVINTAVSDGVISKIPESEKIEFAAFSVTNYLTHITPENNGFFGIQHSVDEIIQLCYDMFITMLS